jgi:DNA repair protein RecO (recombination protein O)
VGVNENHDGPKYAANHLAAISTFELVWLKELGYSPRFQECAACGKTVETAPRVPFSPTAIGVVCAACFDTVRDRRWITHESRVALQALASGTRDLPREASLEVRQILGLIVSCILGRRPKMLAYLDGGG